MVLAPELVDRLAPRSCPQTAPDADVEQDGEEDEAAEYGVAPDLADLLDAHQALVEHADQHRAEEGAHDRARAAERAHPADDRRGDRRQLESGAGGDVDVPEAADVEEPGEARQGTARTERGQ